MLVLFVVLFLFFADLCISGPIVRNTSNSTKYVVAHHIVGNTYTYTQQTWLSDIILASKSGIDGFALNVGSDSREPKQVANAYQAALLSGTGFKLFLSLDMTSLPCESAGDAVTLQTYITTYASHPNQLTYNNSVFVSSFSGESCRFGQDSVPSGWLSQFVHPLSEQHIPVSFFPSFFSDTSVFHSFSGVIDGMFNWNSGWPTQITAGSVQNYTAAALDSLSVYVGATTSDQEYIDALRPLGARYMAAVSPVFFTHYGPETYDKNFMYLNDDHLYVRRWEGLIAIRDQIDIIELVSWNDYGESHYLGPIEGAQPESQGWVNGFDHIGWLEITLYYATAFKTGTYPAISQDYTVMWSRPHSAFATSPDPVGPPANYQITQDKIWAVVFTTSPANVTLSTSPTKTESFQVTAGVTKLSSDISPGGFMQAVLQRNGETVIDLHPNDFYFDPSPSSYNFNAFVASST